jgi:catechol 2,3-dioxygenase-like lactoylglutathione lyase family enzyme
MPPRSSSKTRRCCEPRLEGTPFTVIGPPAPLEINPKVVAMQAIGPAGELLYFTRMPPGASKFGLGSARSFVDRVFIVVLGVHDIRRTLDFYHVTFGLPVTEPAPTRVEVLAEAWGLPREQPFLLGIARLPERFLIEVDEYPPAAGARNAAEGELPAGMAMVSFTVPVARPAPFAVRGAASDVEGHCPMRAAGPACCAAQAASTSN